MSCKTEVSKCTECVFISFGLSDFKSHVSKTKSLVWIILAGVPGRLFCFACCENNSAAFLLTLARLEICDKGSVLVVRASRKKM